MAHRRDTRMRKDWNALAGGPLILTGATTVIGGTLAVSAAVTVIRMIGEYAIGPSTVPTALDEVEIGVGIGVVSTDAASLGATAMPDPTDDVAFPWLYWADHLLFFATNSQSAGAVTVSLRRQFDVRSMRRMKADESLVFVVQYTDVVGLPPVHVSIGATRVLFAT